MTTLVGNICLALAALIFCVLFIPLFHYKIAQSNDQGASGYLILIVIFIHLVFLALVVFAYIIIARRGGFAWISENTASLILMLSVSLLSILIVSAISIMTRFTPGPNPLYIQLIGKFAPALILIIVVGTGFILNNNILSEKIPLAFYKWPSFLLSGLCMLGIIVFTFSIFLSGPSGVQEATRKYENAESIKNDRLKEIESYDVTRDAVRILELTGSLYPPEVREKAAAKFRTHPEWQKELVYMLENEHAVEAFNFLQSNEVEDKNLFAEPVNTGVKFVATWIRGTIQGTSPSEFYHDMFLSEVQSVLQTVEKFEGMGIHYLPAVREMRAALDEPVHEKKPKFDCVPILDNWIKKRE